MSEDVIDRRLRDLLEYASDSLTQDEREAIETLIGAGEPTIALEQIGAALNEVQPVIGRRQYQELRELCGLLDADPSFWPNVQPDETDGREV